MADKILELEINNWEKLVERSTEPVIVMFYNENCPHCKTMLPYFEKLFHDFQSKSVFGRINVQNDPWIAERYGIMSVPAFKFFCNGKPVAEIVGAVYPDMLAKMVDNVIIHGKECAEKSSSVDYEITGYA
ncbi:thioredoxin family protein [Methanomicrobium antiquum]|uniref:Thioredoxin family protein n=1 Tax=Methanomicrobium antiquum TaxID=487686 RepID=A0AAF0FQG5_9EURY|nr:thioredoxin family protein [Methanomicrobium antiquum]WFN37702.1 thioredoxin family protein [Methanomicrobium antiquum]